MCMRSCSAARRAGSSSTWSPRTARTSAAHASPVSAVSRAHGMGGDAAGEVASEMAVQIIQRELASVTTLESDDVAMLTAETLRKANRAIHDRTLTEVDKQGMGTTASVLLIAATRYLIGQVGDSRVYLMRDGALTQLTKDHSYVQEQVDAGFLTPEQARYHP